MFKKADNKHPLLNIIINMNRPKILIADDAEVTRTIIREVLSFLEADFLESDTGVGTIRTINKENPDLVLMDISMPAPDGLIILKRMRGTEEFKNTPVIIISVESSPECREEAKKYNASDYLTKPVNFQHLIDSIKKVLPDIKEIPEGELRQPRVRRNIPKK